MGSKTIITVVISLILVVGAAVFIFISSGLSSFDVEKAFTSLPCPTTTRKYLDNSSYIGPLIDTHIHIPQIPDGPVVPSFIRQGQEPILGIDVTIDKYICMMNTEGTKSIFAFFPVLDPIRKESIKIAYETMKRYPNRFVPFIMTPDRDDRTDGFPTVNATVLKEMLSAQPGLFVGYGEIGLYERGDHGGPKGSRALPPDSKRLQEIYPIVEKYNLLVYFHLGEGQEKSFHEVLDQYPKINFIWHGDQLITYRDNGMQNLEVIEDILQKHPNAYYGVDELYGDTWLLRPEINKAEFLKHFEDYKQLLKKDLDTWKDFIERNPNQVLWGTDRGWSSAWSLDQDVALTLNNYSRAFIGKLDPAVQEKFAYKNAELLYQTKTYK